jgi:uncharacterized repeat protein (TIGR01451 family)
MIAPALVDESVSAAPMMASLQDVIISEVAWGGTAANTADEWIELYNPTSSPINLFGWTLISSSDATPSITLTGSIPAGGYYLLEKDDDFTVSNILADQIYTGTLVNGGEILTLTDNLLNTIDTANNDGTAAWNAGSGAPNYYSMMRNMPVAADSTTAWVSNNGINRNGLDANGNPINGTPHNSEIIDLSLIMAVDTTPQIVGNNLVFVIIVKNVGPDSATNVTVKDLLPAGLTYVSDNGLGTYDSGTGIWTVGTLASGAGAALEITANVATGGAKTHWAEVWSADQVDPNSTPGNDSTTEDDDDSVTVTPPLVGSSDLSITKTVNTSNPNIGDSVVFSITVSNAGPDIATNVIVKDLLPSGFSYVSHTSGQTYSAGLWDVGTMPIGPSNAKTLKITAKVGQTGLYTNWAEVWSADQSPTDSRIYGNGSTTEADDDDEPVTPSGGVANLSLTQTNAKAFPDIAGRVVLTITVSNVAGAGLYNATNVIVKDELPTGLTYVSDDGGGAYNKDTDMWSAGAISNGASKSLNITVKVDPTGTMTNWAEVWSADQSPSDLRVYGNASTTEADDASVTVQSADLSITKSMDNVTPSLGQDVVFTIRVSNAGPDAATNVEVKDLLPAKFSYLSDDSGGNYNSSTTGSNAGIWQVGTINSGSSKILKITATMVTGSITVNWAEVWKSDQIDIDSVPGNNSTNTDDDASAPAADLRVDQVVSSASPGLDTNFTFTITVTNDGTVGTTGVEVKDKLPSSLTYVAPYIASVGTYDSGTGIWKIGILNTAASASATLTITAKMTSSGVYTNWAEVWKSDLPDPDSTAGNSSTTEDDDASTTVSFSSIIINEIAWAGTAASPDDEWIELYNPSNASINITGWTLKSASQLPSALNITLSGTISSGGYFLLEREDNFTVSDVTADQIYPGLLLNILSDSGEKLTLRDGSLNIVDTANGNGGPWPQGGLSPNYGSMERKGTSVESDNTWVTNRGNPKNGKDSNNGLIFGTPRKVNSTGIAPDPTKPAPTPSRIPPVGRMIINEYLPRAGFDWNQDGLINVQDEFIEIKNLGPVDVSLNGWKLDDEADQGSAPFSIPAMTVKPDQRVIFYGSTTGILLSDGGDTVRLLNSSGKVIDAHTYSIAKDADRSWCRFPDAINNIYWKKNCLPTPGLVNALIGEVPSGPPDTGLEVPLCPLPDTLPSDYLLAECSTGFGGGIWRPMYWDEGGWLNQHPIYDDKSKWISFVE